MLFISALHVLWVRSSFSTARSDSRQLLFYTRRAVIAPDVAPQHVHLILKRHAHKRHITYISYEDVHRGERPSAMRCAGAAQPHARSSADGHASKPTRRCSWSAETLARVSAGTSSAPSASSSTGRSARRKMRRIRREWLADERARLEFTLRVRHCPYISA